MSSGYDVFFFQVYGRRKDSLRAVYYFQSLLRFPRSSCCYLFLLPFVTKPLLDYPWSQTALGLTCVAVIMNEANEFYKPSPPFLSLLLSNKRQMYVKVLIWKQKDDFSVAEDVHVSFSGHLFIKEMLYRPGLKAVIYLSWHVWISYWLYVSRHILWLNKLKIMQCMSVLQLSSWVPCFFRCWFFIRECVSEPTQVPGMFLRQADHTSSSTQKTSHVLGHEWSSGLVSLVLF